MELVRACAIRRISGTRRASSRRSYFATDFMRNGLLKRDRRRVLRYCTACSCLNLAPYATFGARRQFEVAKREMAFHAGSGQVRQDLKEWSLTTGSVETVLMLLFL